MFFCFPPHLDDDAFMQHALHVLDVPCIYKFETWKRGNFSVPLWKQLSSKMQMSHVEIVICFILGLFSYCAEWWHQSAESSILHQHTFFERCFQCISSHYRCKQFPHCYGLLQHSACNALDHWISRGGRGDESIWFIQNADFTVAPTQGIYRQTISLVSWRHLELNLLTFCFSVL